MISSSCDRRFWVFESIRFSVLSRSSAMFDMSFSPVAEITSRESSDTAADEWLELQLSHTVGGQLSREQLLVVIQ